MDTAKHLIISGMVQGVGYRAWFAQRAQLRGIHGWVRNRHDGTVEAIVRGTEEDVEHMILLAQDGPIAAKVTDVAIADAPPGGWNGFEIRPTE